MPTYKYDCWACGVRSEALRGIRDRDAPFKCPDCGDLDTKRTASAPIVQTPLDGNLRGSGKRDMDRMIGADAEKRHDSYDTEREKRNDVRRATGQRAVGRRVDGTYAPMSKAQLDARQGGFDKFEFAKRTGKKVIH